MKDVEREIRSDVEGKHRELMWFGLTTYVHIRESLMATYSLLSYVYYNRPINNIYSKLNSKLIIH